MNILENITGESEPPRYLSPESEARAKAEKEKLEILIKNGWFIESSAGSGLLVHKEVSELDKHF